jgi:hypothetical protein
MTKTLLQITKPDELNFICTHGLGDTMLLTSNRTCLEQKYGAPVHFIIKPSHKIVMAMYGNNNFNKYEFSDQELDEIAKKNPMPEKGELYIAHPIYSGAGLFEEWEREAYPASCLFSRFLQIEESPAAAPVSYPELSLAIMNSLGFPVPDMDKTALLLPEARSVKALNKQYWEKLVKKLRKKGFFVVQSYTRGEFALEDVPALPDSLDTVVAFALACGRVYSLRSGLCDLIAHKAKNLTVFYTAAFAYKAYYMPGKRIRNVLVRDVYLEIKQGVKKTLKKIPLVKNAWESWKRAKRSGDLPESPRYTSLIGKVSK